MWVCGYVCVWGGDSYAYIKEHFQQIIGFYNSVAPFVNENLVNLFCGTFCETSLCSSARRIKRNTTERI